MKKYTVAIVAIMAIALVAVCYIIGTKPAPTPAPVQHDVTQMRVVNETKDSVLMYLTLSGYPSPQDTSYIQTVNGIFGCTQNGLNGNTWIAPGDSFTYTPTKMFSGNISFGVAPMNCFTNAWPTGMNLFEFNLNEPQESLDISCMAGVNCILGAKLIGGPAWPADTASDPRVLQNDSMWHNTGRVGVYPYGCTNCTNTAGHQDCQTPQETPNKYSICNPTRAAGDHGGLVRVAFKGYTNTQICK